MPSGFSPVAIEADRRNGFFLLTMFRFVDLQVGQTKELIADRADSTLLKGEFAATLRTFQWSCNLHASPLTA